ncbi:MAG: SGNH/GDSL hydrolase family protein [Magnetococcales bacterium]|nr:SGNH/GDSL hydrolase family protein [Magnetococcales bacterium]MBF0323393.1 SGNH/GDSL hydrolase family protein [Magnetococcales bacterium]
MRGSDRNLPPGWWIGKWLVFLGASLVVFCYGLHFDTFVILLGLLWLLFRLASPANAITFSVVLALMTLCLWGGIELLGLNKPFYRLHEKLAYFDREMGFSTYQKNVSASMEMPFGDLRAMSSHMPPLEAPRTISCQTDSLGFRNTQDYHGQPFLVVGDSFVVGVGNTQSQTLDRQLADRYGMQAYNLGHPGDASDYLQRIQYFRAHFSERPKFLVFLFEGNDFPAKDRPIAPQSWLRTLKENYALLSKNRFSNFITMKRNQIKVRRKNQDPGQDPAGSFMVGDREMAYYKLYRENTERTHYVFPPGYVADLRLLLQLSHKVFFIPTKYRVYGPESTLPPQAYWERLNQVCQEAGTPCINLTAPMQIQARHHLEQGQTLWWRDDTHWNPLGIAVAAEVVWQTAGRSIHKTP